jgi:hypothetical protein
LQSKTPIAKSAKLTARVEPDAGCFRRHGRRCFICSPLGEVEFCKAKLL